MSQTSVNRMLQDAVQESMNGMLPKLIKTISESITASISEQFSQFEQKLNTIQARSQTFLWWGSNWSNFGTFYDYAWIIL